MVAPWAVGQPQSLIARRAIGKQSVATLRPLSLVVLPDIPRIPNGWDQGRSFRCLRQRYVARRRSAGARFSGSPIEVGFPRSAAAGLRNKLCGSRRSAVGHDDQFPPPSRNARCRFGEVTFAGIGGKEEHAPKAAESPGAIESPFAGSRAEMASLRMLQAAQVVNYTI
jgi:hypothetical protein